ncbi:hypothetical protein AWB79_06168 [Caballeronia hypogeia]|uniref:Uncharacterized protein n=1 Tax=Caballeronia hypogeia TaxID=1777140 RepID=A0A158CY48_9BURK|nr:hypothetical protein AWB79_06168 [Caballeronia hypogeia]
MSERVTHHAQVDLSIGHVRSRAVPQPVSRSFFQQVGTRRRHFIALTKSSGGPSKHLLDDRMQGGAR